MDRTKERVQRSERYLAARATVETEAVADLMSAGVNSEMLEQGIITNGEAKTVLGVVFDLAEEGMLSSHEVVKEELKERGIFGDIGGQRWWSDWLSEGWGVDDFDYHLERVLSAYEIRVSAEELDRARSIAEDGTITVRERRDGLREAVTSLVRAQMQRTDTLMRTDTMRRTVETELRNQDADMYLKTGIWSFDDVFGGLPFSRITIGSARPGHGKTLVSEVIAVNCSKRWSRNGTDKQVLYFDMENDRTEKSIRLLTQLCNRGIQTARNGIDAQLIERVMQGDVELRQESAQRLQEGLESLTEIRDHLVVDRTTSPTSEYIRARTMSEDRRREVGLVIVDYAEIMHEDAHNRNEKVTLAAEGLHALARDMEVPVLLNSQLARSADKKEEPTLEDLAWSDALGKIARMVFCIVHPHTRWTTTAGEEGEPPRAQLDLFVRKNKGPLGQCDLRILPSCLTVYDPMDPELEMEPDEEVPF